MAYKPAWGTFSGGEAFAVGAIFVSTVDTDPASLLGYGTWTAVGAGRVLVGLDSGDADFDTLGETGGAKTVASAGSNAAGSAGTPAGTISWPAGVPTATWPVSVPTFAGSALGTHTHGAGTYIPSAHAGTAVAAHASHTHTYTDVPNHLHTLATGTTATGNFSQVIGTVDTSSGGTGGTPTQTALATLSGNPTAGVATGTTAGPSASLTHTVTQPDAHTMSGSSEAVSAGTPAGTVAWPAGVPAVAWPAGVPTFAGSALANHNHAFTGSATSVVQPFLVVRLWKRTA